MTRTSLRRPVAAALLAVGALALVACGSDASVTEAKDGKVTVQGKGKRARVTIKGENGATVTYNQRQVPSDFPGAVPQPARLALTGATSATRGGKQYFQLTYALGAGSARAALGAYATRLGDAGFAVDAVEGPTSDRAPAPMRATGPGWRVVAVATGAGGAGSMVVTVDNA